MAICNSLLTLNENQFNSNLAFVHSNTSLAYPLFGRLRWWSSKS